MGIIPAHAVRPSLLVYPSALVLQRHVSFCVPLNQRLPCSARGGDCWRGARAICPLGPARQVEDAVKWMAGVGRWWWRPTGVGLLSCCAPTRGLIDVRSPLLAPKCVAFRSASRIFCGYPQPWVRSIRSRLQSKAVDVARTTVLKSGQTICQFPFARTYWRLFVMARQEVQLDSASAAQKLRFWLATKECCRSSCWRWHPHLSQTGSLNHAVVN